MTRTLVAAAVAAAAVVAAGLVLVPGTPSVWRSTATVVVLPGPAAPGPAYFRALADGEVPAGFASAMVAIAEARTGDGPRVDVTLAPGTSTLTVSAESGTPETAAAAANAVADESVRELGTSRPPFVLVPAARAEPANARPSGTSREAALIVLACVAVTAAFAVGQTAWLWSAFGRRRRGHR